MSILKSLQSTLRVLGISERDGKFQSQVYLFLGVQCAVVVNSLCFLADNWQDVDDRILALKTISVLSTFAVYSILFIYNWTEFLSVIDMFHRTNYKIPYEISNRRKHMIDLFEANIAKLNKSWWTMVLVYLASLNTIPVTIVLVKLLFFNGDFQAIIKENLSSPFPLYYPEFMKSFGKPEWLTNIIVYVIGYSLHSAYTLYAAMLARLVYDTAMCAITNVEYELKLLTLSLAEIKDLVKKQGNKALNKNDALQNFLKYFVKHHQDTYRRFNIVDKGVRWITATLSSIASIYICMSIYTIVQKDHIVLKIEESLFFGIWATAIYLFDDYGERVMTENENLRNALYEISWIEKPLWFKKSLLLIMTRTCKTTELKPFGLFILNLNNFAKTMNAAYSYYNLLYKFKAKQN